MRPAVFSYRTVFISSWNRFKMPLWWRLALSQLDYAISARAAVISNYRQLPQVQYFLHTASSSGSPVNCEQRRASADLRVADPTGTMNRQLTLKSIVMMSWKPSVSSGLLYLVENPVNAIFGRRALLSGLSCSQSANRRIEHFRL